MSECKLSELDSGELIDRVDDLADVLHASVQLGASVNFILPFCLEDSRSFWRDKVLPAVQQGGRILIVAKVDDRVVGTVQLAVDMPPNQPHRCEVTKLLVHPGYRNRGIARALMGALEQRALDLGKRLITLDTRTGYMAEPLYRSLGYRTAGVIPGYCRATAEDRYDSTTYMYKALPRAGEPLSCREATVAT